MIQAWALRWVTLLRRNDYLPRVLEARNELHGSRYGTHIVYLAIFRINVDYRPNIVLPSVRTECSVVLAEREGLIDQSILRYVML